MSRRDIYYWKCDRPAAFHGTQECRAVNPDIEPQLREALRLKFAARQLELTTAPTQGNHLTWNAIVDGIAMFVRVENGPEQDDHLELESALLDQVRAVGVPTPTVYGCDATRTQVPFAWQAMERIACQDLNHWHKQGSLDVPRIAFDIGAAVAKWQAIRPPGYGPFDSRLWRETRRLAGYHTDYGDYFRLRLEAHLEFLVTHQFLNGQERAGMIRAIASHRELLKLDAGCLVHKDLALWNVLGTANRIAAFIDFDDAICGDPIDDLSLLACFHDATFMQRAFAGYQSIRPLPENHLRRFWLHLLRNLIVKAVIRVGAGYFERDDGFFLIGAGRSGADLRTFTRQRLALAIRGLETNASLSIL